ncbi:MAG: hypothetical protein P8176_11520, partial [Gammaproteobacteria bacterium]
TRYQASGLATISKIINKIGNGAVALDAMMRGVKVMGIKEVGGDWLRESVRQLTGFGRGREAQQDFLLDEVLLLLGRLWQLITVCWWEALLVGLFWVVFLY